MENKMAVAQAVTVSLQELIDGKWSVVTLKRKMAD